MPFCVLGVSQWIIVQGCVCLRNQIQKECVVIDEEDSVLKFHQPGDINQSSAVINNRVIRSLFPQQLEELFFLFLRPLLWF